MVFVLQGGSFGERGPGYENVANREVFDYGHQHLPPRSDGDSRDGSFPLQQGPNVSNTIAGSPTESESRDQRDGRSSGRDNMPRGEDKGGEKWMTDTPTNTVLLRGLPPAVDEKDVRKTCYFHQT